MQTDISNIYTTDVFVFGHYPKNSFSAFVFAYAIDHNYLEPIVREERKLHGKQAFNTNYGPFRTGGTIKGFEKYKNLGYMLFGEDFENAFGSTQQLGEKGTNCPKSKEATINFLKNTPVEKLQSLAIQIHPIYGNGGSDIGHWEQGNSYHGYPLTGIKPVYDNYGNEIDRELEFNGNTVLLSEFAKNGYVYSNDDDIAKYLYIEYADINSLV